MRVNTGKGRSDIADLYPLAPLQQGLWYHELLEPASGTYVVQSVMRIEGSLNREALRRAWEAVVARHAVLRTRIVWEGLEHPLQLVQPEVELPWAEQDWRDSPADEAPASLWDFLDTDRVRGLDLTQAPLMRLTLLQVAENSVILVWSFHHLILDRWSVDVVLQEVWSAYEALVEGRPLQFGSLRPYRDYLQWLKDQDLNRAEQFWRQLLSGFTAPTVLGVDQVPVNRAEHQEERYDFTEATVSEADTMKLSQWARQQKLTVNTVVQGAWSLLLSRYSATEDVVFGATVSGRSAGLPGIESMVGLFINSLPVRVHVSPSQSLVEWLRELQGQQVKLREYEHTPLFEIQKWSEVPAGESLFNTLLVFESTPLESGEHLDKKVAGLHVQPVAGRGGNQTNYPLAVILVPGRTLRLRFEYDTRHYTAEAVNRMVGHFQRVLAGMVGGTGQQRLGAIPLLTEAERRLMLVEWNATERDYPRNVCLYDLFEVQVDQTPDAVALAFGEDALTYDELNTRANHLARLMHRQYGVGPEVCVGLCMERSLEMVVGILAILKAGGAYVPLDPAYPPARLAYILDDARVQVLLTQDRLFGHLPQSKGKVICVDTDPACFPSGKASTPDSRAAAGNVAYLIYTSGSTGQPKGVAIEHRSAVALLHWAKEVFEPEELQGVLASTSICFDLSVFELFVPLSCGGTVILAENILDLAELPNAEAVTLINTVPSGIAGLLRGTTLPASVRTVNLAGEPLRPQLVREIEKAGTVERVYDLYGPSEDTTYSTKALREGQGPEIIGRPIANTQAYLLDQSLEPVPIGVSGEVYLGGEGLARGYYNRFALTAEKFIPDPFAHKDGGRLYKTGDVARYLDDGTIQYLGRVDHQVKIRGYRIELGEIETTLSQFPGIKEAVVVAREDEPGDKRVVAYLVPEGEPLLPLDLRQFLKQTLPEYMVPAAFVVLEALPLTPNGKLDRRALPKPGGSLTGLFENYVPPRNPVEAVLVEMWENLLQVRQVGVHDNFFELGGHSLLATQVVSRMYQEFEVELSLQMFFEAPTVAGIADFLSSAAVAGEAVARPQLVPVSREERLPLSFAQERLWLVEQLDPDSTAYSMPSAFRISGSLNVSALEQSLVQLIQRHETLRTSYAVVNVQPVQEIASGENFSLPVIDLQAHSPDERESAVRQQIQQEHNRPFDLVQGPLFRACLLRLAPEESVLIFVLHHSIADGLSMNILYRELATGYDAACHGGAVKRSALPVQYADYSVWQRQWLQGAALDSLLTYWTEQLAGGPPQLALPTDFPRPPVQTHRGAHHSIQLPESVVSSLRALSQAEGVTMFMSMLAAFVLVLSRHSGQQDIVVGTPVANRPRPELEGMIGLFLNTLVLRTNLSGDPTMRELLQRVRDVCLGAYAHQELPFERLVEALQPERDLSRTPIFQVFFNFIDASEMTLTLPGLEVSPLGEALETTKFDFTLYVILTGEGATVQWSYNSDLFDAGTIAWMADQFQTVLMQLQETPDAPISSVSLLREEDRARRLASPDPVCLTQAFTSFPETAVAQSIPARFEEQVHQRPEQLAVHTPQHRWTYEEVNRRANQIAHTLLSRKFPADTRVALLCAHDAPMVAAILGVLKAGYTYVPLDPSFPTTRLETIVADAGVQAILAESAYLSLAHELGEAAGQVLNIDEVLLAHANTGNPQRLVSPDTLAYVLYTSGTTGVPKGVMQSHHHVLHHIRVYTNNLHLHPGDRLTLLASYGFDAAVMDLFGALLNGATLYPLDLKETDPANLSAWMQQHGITIYHSTPTVFRYWINALGEGSVLPALRLIVLGGEAASRADFEAYQRHFGPNCIFVNGLGPTESTVTLQFVADHATKIIGQTVPVGHPVEHTEITLLNQDGKETEVFGEIAIRSPYVAVGYWQQPELTRQVFEQPMEPGSARLYRTGDMGRRRYDGSLEFMGRKDTQAKIRGYRIELGEIETALAQHFLVQKAVVLHRDDGPAGPYLVGYLLTSQDTTVSPDALRSFLRKRLPDYMVPSAWVELDVFPLTPNGKIDRKALPLPDAPGEKDDLEVVLPRTPIEAAVTAIWQTVLKLDQVGIQDNFFDLGGHSLLATQVMSRVRESFAVTLPLRLLFEAPTVAGLAAAIMENEEPSPTGLLAPIQPLPPGGAFPLSFCQERMWFLYQFAPTSAAYNISQTVYFPGSVNFDALERAVNEIRRRHAVLRTVFPAEDGYPVPQIYPFSPLSIPVKDFRDCPEETQNAQAQRFASAQAKQPFDMAQGPLMRVAFLRMQAEQVIVLLTLHHIISDGWSAGVIRRELQTLYEAFAAGQPSPLDEIPIQYQDFAAWQREWLQGELLDTQLTYWTERLAGAPMILDLPLDRPRGAMQTFNGGRHIVKFSRELTVSLTQLIQQEDVTLFMALLASLSILLGRYTASDDLLVGSPIANRHFLAIESLIGTFVNTLVLRTQLEGNPSFLELLHQVRHTTLEAYAHQDLPFEVLVDALHPPRDLSRSPVFQVMLSVLNFEKVHTTEKNNPSGNPSGIALDSQAAQFDLTVALAERPDHRHIMAWSYNSDLFEHATIGRMSEQFVHLLNEVVADPHRRIHDLTLLPERERQQLLVEWNATAQPSNFPGQCLPALLETRAAQQPESIAVVFEGQAVTYGHLNQRANQLAHYLRKLGVGPDVRVAVHCERSLDMILAVWGTVKAGGAYVPLDPTYPRERVALMLEDAGVAVVLAQQHSEYTLPPHAAKVVWMDADWAAIEQEPKHNPPTEVTPDNLAYMIYTSGSTGKPKGVQIPHRALMNFLETMAREPGMDASDRLLAVTSLSFDIAGLELFLPVLVGGQVVLASREMAADGMQIIECLNTEAITVMQATPVTWQLLLAQGWTGQPGLRVLCGGEQISLEVAHQLLERVHCLWNLYGPTETTVWSTVLALDPQMQRISIGRPVANTQVYLQDPWGHPVPIGAPGELCIGGDGVSRGYWNRPDITARQFVPDPYSAVPGTRMYRTGDAVRYRPDGRLEWLARMDNQIKLRGYRIELGEIEAVLRRQPAVSEAVVLIRNQGVGDGLLVAYVSMEAGYAFDQAGLRESLQKILPGYMVPSVFVGLEAFPLTPNGKIDRKALPAPEAEDRTRGTSYVAPRTVLEELLVDVWQKVLKIDRIGIHDNFFELGGHSLSATRVIARLRNELDLDIPLLSIFEHPVIEEMTLDITAQLVDIVPDTSGGVWSLSEE